MQYNFRIPALTLKKSKPNLSIFELTSVHRVAIILESIGTKVRHTCKFTMTAGLTIPIPDLLAHLSARAHEYVPFAYIL